MMIVYVYVILIID